MHDVTQTLLNAFCGDVIFFFFFRSFCIVRYNYHFAKDLVSNDAHKKYTVLIISFYIGGGGHKLVIMIATPIPKSTRCYVDSFNGLKLCSA